MRNQSFSTEELRKYNEKIEKTQLELKKLENLTPEKAKQTIAIMARGGKEGVFSDKTIDDLKEPKLSLREMYQVQIDGL